MNTEIILLFFNFIISKNIFLFGLTLIFYFVSKHKLSYSQVIHKYNSLFNFTVKYLICSSSNYKISYYSLLHILVRFFINYIWIYIFFYIIISIINNFLADVSIFPISYSLYSIITELCQIVCLLYLLFFYLCYYFIILHHKCKYFNLNRISIFSNSK